MDIVSYNKVASARAAGEALDARLTNVDNTSDANKPTSTALQAELDTKEAGVNSFVASGALTNGDVVSLNADGTVSVVANDTDGVLYSEYEFSTYNRGPTYTHMRDDGKVFMLYEDSGNVYALVGEATNGTTFTYGTSTLIRPSTVDMWSPSVDYSPFTDSYVVSYTESTNNKIVYHIVTIDGLVPTIGAVDDVQTGARASRIDIGCKTLNNRVIFIYADADDAYKTKYKVGTISGYSISFGSATVVSSTEMWTTVVFIDVPTSETAFVVLNNDQNDSWYVSCRIFDVYNTSATLRTALYDPTLSTMNGGDFYGVYHAPSGDVFLSKGTEIWNIKFTSTTITSITSILIGPNHSIHMTYIGNTFFFLGGGSFVNPDTSVTQAILIDGHLEVVGDWEISSDTNHAKYGIRYNSIFGTLTCVYQEEIANRLAVKHFRPPSTVTPGTTTLGANNTAKGLATVYNTLTDTTIIMTTNNFNLVNAYVCTNSNGIVTSSDPILFYAGDVDFEPNSLVSIEGTDQVVLTYIDRSDLNKVKAVVGTIAAGSITFGTPVEVTTDSDTECVVTYDTASSKLLFLYVHKTTYDGYYIVGTINGTSITFGVADTFLVGTMDEDNLGASFNPIEGKGVITYRESLTGYIRTFTIVGDTASFGAAVSLGGITDLTYGPSIDINYSNALGKFLMSVRDSSQFLTIRTVSLTGTDVNLGPATDYEETQGTVRQHAVAFDSVYNKVVVLAASPQTTLSYLDINTSTDVITRNNEYLVIDNQTLYTNYRSDFVTTAAGNSIFTYIGHAASTRIGEFKTWVNSLEFIGISNETVADTDPVEVTTLKGIATNQTGLTIGAKYYVDTDGTLTTTDTGVRVGRALSATELQITGGV